MDAAAKTTILRRGGGEYTEKKSVFTGYAAPAATKEEAERFIAEIRAEHPDARHNVFAYLVTEGNATRYSDDGEPQGTGGMPVLDVIRKSGVCDAAIVVSRYFGGILLGAPGLVRAYTSAAAAALGDAGIVTLRSYTECVLKLDYSAYTRLEQELDRFEAKRDGSSYDDRVTLRLAIPTELYGAFCAKITESTSGRCAPESAGTRFDA